VIIQKAAGYLYATKRSAAMRTPLNKLTPTRADLLTRRQALTSAVIQGCRLPALCRKTISLNICFAP